MKTQKQEMAGICLTPPLPRGTWLKLAIGAVTLLLLSSCINPFGGNGLFSNGGNGGPENGTAGDYGSLSVRNGTVTTSSIIPDIEAQVSVYRVTLSRQEETLSADFSPEESMTVESVPAGSWEVTLDALDGDANRVATGAVSVEISQGETTEVTVTVTPLTQGTGTLSLELSGPPTLVDGIQSATLAPAGGGQASSLSFNPDGDGNGASYTGTHDAGQYELAVILEKNALSVATVMEAIHVFPNLETGTPEGGLVLESGDIAQPPAAPTALTAEPTAGSEWNSISLSWTDNSLIETGYEIEGRESGGSWAALGQATHPASTTSYTHDGLSEATSYEYRVRALNDFGVSAYATVTVSTEIYPYVFVRASDGSDTTGTGLQGAPYATIGHAISQAVSGQEVRVAEGLYDEFVTLKKGVSLYGGYSGSDWSVRDASRSSYVTTIRYTSGGTTVLADGFDDSVETRVDGFVIQSADPGNEATGHQQAVRVVSASPIFSNNTIEVHATGSYFVRGVNIYDNKYSDGITAKPVFRDNIVRGDTDGDVTRASLAFDIGGNAYGPVVIENNTIDAGAADGTTYGIRRYEGSTTVPSSLVVRNNTFDGGDASTSSADGSYGIHAYDAEDELIIENNTFVTGSTGYYQHGLYLEAYKSATVEGNTFTGTNPSTSVQGTRLIELRGAANSGDLTTTIHDNTFELAGVPAGISWGLYVEEHHAGSVALTGNTFRGINTTDTAPAYVAVEVNNASSSVSFEGNLIAGVHGGPSTGILVRDSSPAITNNVIYRRDGGANSFTGVSVEPGGFTDTTSTKPAIDNNTIVYQNSSSSDFIGINFQGASNEDVAPIVRNNLIASTTSSATGAGVQQDTTLPDRDQSAPELFQNNGFHNVATLWNFTDGNMTDLTAIVAINTEADTTLGAPGTADGNVSAVPDFNDPADGNNDQTDDFELTTATTNDLLQGGRDLSGDADNAVTEDFNGAARTPPFTIGAYEQDGS
jgi:hypothetical protein